VAAATATTVMESMVMEAMVQGATSASTAEDAPAMEKIMTTVMAAVAAAAIVMMVQFYHQVVVVNQIPSA
jgi:predicted thioredoxin/glutaredoxin